ncbi:hypothetical protein QJS10_CPB17g01169 [Acorus calamus]|uniref:Uncharacterized protein n=1 Tax=Acorus calamus TaxID=4465 RepID=A0AAV9CST7_ACOCL|nr:hypothetical protein QJS10_CPB17g01169 [Acorus calamus]
MGRGFVNCGTKRPRKVREEMKKHWAAEKAAEATESIRFFGCIVRQGKVGEVDSKESDQCDSLWILAWVCNLR